jgi:hypothetical protein
VSTAITIRGGGFVSGTTVSVGTLVLNAAVASPVHLNVSVPPQPVGAFGVVVTNPDGRSARAPAGFRVESHVPLDPVPFHLSGQVLVGESDIPVAGATLRPALDPDQPPASAVTDDEGRFVLDGIIERSQAVPTATSP